MVNGAPARARTALCRVTLVGERRRVDLVLPADEPVGLLLPDVLRLLGDPSSEVPLVRRLVTAQGDVLAQDVTLASAGIADGAVVRLVREQETPPAPVVHDVTDEAADDVDVRAWRWGSAARDRTAGAACVLLAVAAGVFARSAMGAQAAGVGLLTTAVLAAIAGSLAARAGRAGLGAALLALCGAVGFSGVWDLADAGQWSGIARLAALVGVVSLVLALLGAFSALGRGGFVGAVTVAGVGGAWWVSAALVDGSAERAAIALLVLSVVALGVVPRLALSGAGLTSLDDRRAGGASVSRLDVTTALCATHRGLALATVVLALSAGAAGWLVARDASPWSVALAALLVIVLFSRARAYPLVIEVVALQTAGTVVGLRLLWMWMERGEGTEDTGGGSAYGAVAAVCAAVALTLVLLAVRPPEHVRVRLRRVMNMVEAMGVVALLPLAIGAFGTYGRLLDTF
ncbi:EsaB/YukD family protein [Streptomyces sp. NPDC048172]|uniref:EsaB/YukD family protein n=1 Tax=Streptomyces sp. NPDC048172 TaxID=3365505 RepID=UPI0037176099